MAIAPFALQPAVPRKAAPETFQVIEELFERLKIKVNQLIAAANAEDTAIIASIGAFVVGPAVSVDGQIMLFDGITGKLAKAATGSGPVHATAGVYSVGPINFAGGATEVTGDLQIANFNSGTDASASTFWAGDGTWRQAGQSHNLLSDVHPDTIPGETPEIAAIVIGKAYTAGLAEGFWADGLPFASAPGPNDPSTNQFWADGLPIAEMGTISGARWGKLDPPATFGNLLRGGPTGLFWDDNTGMIAFLDALENTRWLKTAEATVDPAVADLVTLAGMAVYMKNDKFVIAYNRAGTMTFITIPMDGATVAWTHGTTAP
jgi:hypothetical protein